MNQLPQLPSSIAAISGSRNCAREELVALGCNERQISTLLPSEETVEVFLKVDAFEKLEHEKKIYDFLKDLQGHCVPQLIGHGIFVKDEQDCVLVMEHAGRRMMGQDLRKSGVLQEIFHKLDQIHARNVVLVDLKVAHLLWSTQKGIMFIDFDLSVQTTADVFPPGGDREVRGFVNYPNKMATGIFFGTPIFASINLQLGLRPSPSSDYESLYYVTSFLFRNPGLTWIGIHLEQEDAQEAVMIKKVEYIMKHPELLRAILDNDCARLRLLIEMEAETPRWNSWEPGSNCDSSSDSNSGSESKNSDSCAGSRPLNPHAAEWTDPSSPSSLSLPNPPRSPMDDAELASKKQQLLNAFRAKCQNLLSSNTANETAEAEAVKAVLKLGSDCIALDVGQELGTQGYKGVCDLCEYRELTRTPQQNDVNNKQAGDSKTMAEFGIFSPVNLRQKHCMNDNFFCLVHSTLACPLPEVKVAVGEIKVSWGDLTDAVKTRLDRLEAALLVASATLQATPPAPTAAVAAAAASHHCHPLCVLSLGMQAVVSVTSEQALGSVEMAAINKYLRENRTWFPRVYLLAIADRFFIHKSDNAYKYQVLEAGRQVAALAAHRGCISQPVMVMSAEMRDICSRVAAIAACYGKKKGTQEQARLQRWLSRAVADGNPELLLLSFEFLIGQEDEMFFEYAELQIGAK